MWKKIGTLFYIFVFYLYNYATEGMQNLEEFLYFQISTCQHDHLAQV
jgi:hypothetical protein